MQFVFVSRRWLSDWVLIVWFNYRNSSKWVSEIHRRDKNSFRFIILFTILFPVQQRYVICLVNIFVITVSLGSRMCFSMILTQMVFIPNLNQTKNPNHEIICPAKLIQETSQDNQTSTVSKKVIAPNWSSQKGVFLLFFFCSRYWI